MRRLMGELTTKAMKLATRAGGVASETAIVVDTYALSVSTRMFLESCRSGTKDNTLSRFRRGGTGGTLVV